MRILQLTTCAYSWFSLQLCLIANCVRTQQVCDKLAKSETRTHSDSASFTWWFFFHCKRQMSDFSSRWYNQQFSYYKQSFFRYLELNDSRSAKTSGQVFATVVRVPIRFPIFHAFFKTRATRKRVLPCDAKTCTIGEGFFPAAFITRSDRNP